MSGPRWLFSRRVDLALFGGSAALALALFVAGRLAGLDARPLPALAWFALVLCVDVAHVWGTLFRVYLDRAELRRRPLLYGLTPLACFAGAALAWRANPLLFWRALAYLAVWHFVRQQAGWVALYQRRNGEAPRAHWPDRAAVYAATLFPLLWWHAHLPRPFDWFVPGDFLPLVPSWLARALHPVHFAVMGAWALWRAALYRRGQRNQGVIVLVLSTWACWYLGIVWAQGDWSFTVTNVLAHGIPYAGLTWWYARGRYTGRAGLGGWLVRGGVLAVLATLAACAFGEEALWDRWLWHEHTGLFGGAVDAASSPWLAVVVPLLAVPQLTHYVLDGFVWRGGAANPHLAEALGWRASPDA